MRATLSLAEARRLAITAQGFGRQPKHATAEHVRQLARRIHAFQIDSVNVLVRAHYMPAFARLGPYPAQALDNLTYVKRDLFEFWGHAACLMPVSLFPLLRYRMRSDLAHQYMASPEGVYVKKAYAEVRERGPLAATDLSEPGVRTGNWWGWASGKAALEYLFDAGLVSIADRRGFERLYDITERVIPPAALEAPTLPRESAMKELICLAAQACGVGTQSDLTRYFYVDQWRDRRPPEVWLHQHAADQGRARPIAHRLVTELVEEGRLLPVRVEGWKDQAYLDPAAKIPRSVDARALVTPFDSLVWERARIARLFGMQYSIELYTPQTRRIYGYYVCPFLLGDDLVARCDLKADRQRRVLVVQSAFLEPGRDAPRAAAGLRDELREMQEWLQLDRLEVMDRGDLASALK